MSSPQLQAAAELERRRRSGQLTLSAIWQPNPDRDGLPNPQRLALESKADILGYGGSAGGGKSNLLLGNALTSQTRSVIFRRVYPSLKGLIQDSIDLIGSDTQYNKTEKIWRINDRLLEFGAVQYENDKSDWRGRPHDFYGFDEATEFTRSQFEFIIGWLRTTLQNQRCRVILTFNPPTDDSGSWVIDYFLPWIAFLFPKEYTHPNPAAPGELRWYATLNGKETECLDGQPFDFNGETIRPLSRTFIPAKLADNPHLANTNYISVLQSLPEPLRSQVLYGDFAAASIPNPWQAIPTEWVRLAQKRWFDMERPDLPLSGVGVDVARGGKDNLVISKRYGDWFDELDIHPGVTVTDGPSAAGYVNQSIKDEQPYYINIDVIGVGTSAYDSLKDMYQSVNPINVAVASEFRDRSGRMKARNLRAEMYWAFREALDPEHGDNLALPPGNELLADLCCANYKMSASGFIIEEKDEIKKRIGRSPDLGEAIMLAHLSAGFGIRIGGV